MKIESIFLVMLKMIPKEFKNAKTIEEKKKIVIADVRNNHDNDTMERMINYCWDILDHTTDFIKLLEFYWSDLQFLAPETLPGSMNNKLIGFFNTINSPGRYIVHLIWQNGYIHRAGRNSIAVREFTEGARGEQPDRPSQPLSREKAEFIVSMVCSEMVELLQSVLNPEEDPIDVIRNLCNVDYNANYMKPSADDAPALIAEQADAMVDAMYYMYDTATRMGVNLDRVFNVVQEANMAKRGPEGKFVIRESDNKIMKPDGWQEPDILGEIENQMQKGAWS